VIGEDVVFSVGSDCDDGAQHTGAVDQPMLAVEGVAVGVTERNHFFFPAIGIEPVNLVDSFVAYVEEPRWIPHRTLGKTKARAHHAQFGVVIH
jgi:hypothetical protein